MTDQTHKGYTLYVGNYSGGLTHCAVHPGYATQPIHGRGVVDTKNKINQAIGERERQEHAQFYQAALTCLEWLGTDDDDNEPETLEEGLEEALEAICEHFLVELGAGYVIEALEVPTHEEHGNKWVRAGHDFILTVQGHGSGFWDRPELWGQEQADKLTQLCEPFYIETYTDGGELTMCHNLEDLKK